MVKHFSVSMVLVVKNLPANEGNRKRPRLIPGLGRSPGGRHSNPLQYSCLGNPMDRGAWQATVHSVAKSLTQLKRLSIHAHPLRQGKRQGDLLLPLLLNTVLEVSTRMVRQKNGIKDKNDSKRRDKGLTHCRL